MLQGAAGLFLASRYFSGLQGTPLVHRCPRLPSLLGGARDPSTGPAGSLSLGPLRSQGTPRDGLCGSRARNSGFIPLVSVSLPLAPGSGWLHPLTILVFVATKGPEHPLFLGAPSLVDQAFDSWPSLSFRRLAVSLPQGRLASSLSGRLGILSCATLAWRHLATLQPKRSPDLGGLLRLQSAYSHWGGPWFAG